MGLDTSHDCWHGAYGAFTRFRTAIAKAAGYPIGPDESLGGRDFYQLPWDQFEDKNYYGEWDRVPGDDPLIVLLVHSDCDGVIHPEHGVHLAKRLRELAPLLSEEGGGHIDSMRAVALRFADGLEDAAALDEDVVFS